jgi:DNA-binding MarR family transcriptional regulator
MSRGKRRAALATLSAEVRGWQVDQELFDAAAAELAGLNRTQWRCLDILGTRGPMTAGQLAVASNLTTGAVTVVVDHLEAAGLARRVRDTVDRRRVIIETTDEMARRAALFYGPLVAESEELLGRFGAGQLEVITEFIRRERGLLTRHTARAQALLTTGRSPGMNAESDALP